MPPDPTRALGRLRIWNIDHGYIVTLLAIPIAAIAVWAAMVALVVWRLI